MSLKVCARAGALLVLVGSVAAVTPVSAVAQTTPTFKVAWYNIQSGKGEPAMTGHTSTFADTTNCTDTTQPLNAWGVGKIQKELIDKVGNDPKMVAFGLAEAWFCGTEGNVQKLLGWKAKAGNQNGVTMVAKYGFAGPQEWVQLDTSLNPNPVDTMWVLRVPVCLDAACSQSINIFASHWYSSGTNKLTSYDKQAAQTVAFLQRAGGSTPHILIGDLNVWDGTAPVCNGENPTNIGLQRLRDAGYLDAWPLLHGTAEGFTGMTNRVGCGSPEGYVYKRPDYTWSPSTFRPVSISRFGVVPAGDEAPSDHYGLITEFPFPGPAAIADQVSPAVSLMSPSEGQTFTGGSLTISASASDDIGVTRVDFVEDGVTTASLTSAPYQKSSNLASIDGNHTIEARAFDAAGNVASDLRHISVATSPPVVSATGEIVLYAKNASTVVGNWKVVPDSQAAGGARMWNPDAGAAKLTTPIATPANYFELTFNADAGRAYRIWIRGRADADYWGNDSVWVQFSGAVTATGAPAYRIGTTEGTWLGIEDCSGCGVLGWGWNDNGYGVLGPVISFAAAGTHTIRIQQREDGISLDQIVLSPQLYLTNAPGAAKQDGTILPLTTTATASAPPPPPPLSTTEIVVLAKNASALAGNWMSIPDSTAASGTAVGTSDAGAAKITTASASPTSYVEFTFQADAGTPYHLWIRGRAERDSWANDSAFVQFSGSVDSAGNPAARIGSTSSYVVNLEDDANVGVAGWGWQDNGYGTGVMGSAVRFQASGTQTIRIQTREDGFRLDQIVLSAGTYLNSSPGALKNDTTILR
jgi:Big-like domain-containing protein